MRIDEGMPVEAQDGHCGEVADLVVDPLRRLVTHLVVRREQSFKSKHLVPVAAVEQVTERRVELSWTRSQVAAAEQVESMDDLDVAAWDPALQEEWDVGEVRVLVMPQLLRPSGFDTEGEASGLSAREVYDRVPKGLAEVGDRTPVRDAGGGVVGHVEGFVVGEGFAVTHVVLRQGHRWRHREVSIPVEAVESFSSERVTLSLDAEAVGVLPAVPFHRRRGR